MQGSRGDSGDEDAIVALYLQHLREESLIHPLLKEDEVGLLHLGRTYNRDALRRVIEAYLFQAAEAAIKSAPPSVSRLDAIGRANAVLIALIEDKDVAAPGEVLDEAIRRLWDSD